MRFISKGLTVAAVLVCCWTDISLCQLLYPFPATDLEMVEWLYESGQIDSDERELLEEFVVDSLRVGSDSLEPVDESAVPERNWIGTARHRLYHRANEDDPYRHLLDLRIRSDRVRVDLDIQKYAGRDAETRSRKLSYRSGAVEIDLGSIDPVWCNGLILGRYRRFVDHDSGVSIVYPTLSRYNGVSAAISSGSIDLEIVGSYDRGENLVSEIAGVMLDVRRQDLRLSLSSIAGRLRERMSDGEHRFSAFGVMASGGSNRLKYSVSAAATDGGDVASLVEMRGLPSIRRLALWSCSRDFENVFMGMRSNADVVPGTFGDLSKEIRSRSIGESGVEIENRFMMIGKIDVSLDVNLWRSGAIQKYRVVTRFRRELGERSRVDLSIIDGDDNLHLNYGDRRSALLEYTANAHRNVVVGGSMYYRSSMGSNGRVERRWIDLHCRTGPTGRFLELRVRLYDPNRTEDSDHYLYTVLRQNISVVRLVRFRLSVSTRFGPEQETLDRTKLSISTAVRF